ncbi:MAG: hypothetical protein HW416_2118 [Chloroflexi bacterium]|nr:hypothetical protein [Chloroflexota bacterium]
MVVADEHRGGSVLKPTPPAGRSRAGSPGLLIRPPRSAWMRLPPTPPSRGSGGGRSSTSSSQHAKCEAAAVNVVAATRPAQPRRERGAATARRVRRRSPRPRRERAVGFRRGVRPAVLPVPQQPPVGLTRRRHYHRAEPAAVDQSPPERIVHYGTRSDGHFGRGPETRERREAPSLEEFALELPQPLASSKPSSGLELGINSNPAVVRPTLAIRTVCAKRYRIWSSMARLVAVPARAWAASATDPSPPQTMSLSMPSATACSAAG